MSIKTDAFNNQPERMGPLRGFFTVKRSSQKNGYSPNSSHSHQSIQKVSAIGQSVTGIFQKREETFNTACSLVHIKETNDLKSKMLWVRSLGRKKKETKILKVASKLSSLEEAKQLFGRESGDEKANLSYETAISGQSFKRNLQKNESSECNLRVGNRPPSLWTQTLEKIKKRPQASQDRSALAQAQQLFGQDETRTLHVLDETVADNHCNPVNRKSISGTLRKKAKTFLLNLKSPEEIDTYLKKAKCLFQDAKYTESKKIFEELLELKQDKKVKEQESLLYLSAIYLLENNADKASEYLKRNNRSYLNTVMNQHVTELRSKDKPFPKLDFYEIEEGSEDEKLIAGKLFVEGIKNFVQFFFQRAEYEKVKKFFRERIKTKQLDLLKKKRPEILLYLSAIYLLEGNGLEANKYLKETEDFCLKLLMCDHVTHLLDPKQKGISFLKAHIYEIENGSEDEKIIRDKLFKACGSKSKGSFG
ncbi:MAG: tetratricopeptide repeat protein [Candidatus Rhabdochlamydia sp.]